MTKKQLIEKANQHKAARESGDTFQMAMIENLLTEVNFHTACRNMEAGNYDAVFEQAASFRW